MEALSTHPAPTYFSPFPKDYDKWSCWTCHHSVGIDGTHLVCQRTERIMVYPCGSWEREPGSD